MIPQQDEIPKIQKKIAVDGEPEDFIVDVSSVLLPETLCIASNRPFYSCVLSYLAMNASEAGDDLALIQTSLLFSCKFQLVCIRTS